MRYHTQHSLYFVIQWLFCGNESRLLWDTEQLGQLWQVLLLVPLHYWKLLGYLSRAADTQEEIWNFLSGEHTYILGVTCSKVSHSAYKVCSQLFLVFTFQDLHFLLSWHGMKSGSPGCALGRHVTSDPVFMLTFNGGTWCHQTCCLTFSFDGLDWVLDVSRFKAFL